MNFESTTQFIVTIMTSTLLSVAGIAWLAKILIKFWFDKGLERHKQEMNKETEIFKKTLTQEIEKYKAELLRINADHAVVFSRLHEKRASVIADFYASLSKLRSFLEVHTAIFSYMEKDIRDEKLKEIGQEYIDARKQYETNKIFFDIELATKMEKMMSLIYSETFKRVFYANSNDSNTDYNYEHLDTEYRQSIDLIAKMQTILEEEFRKLLGSAR